jgi:peptidoglycan/xylan/chitin deacetylase (PgdA/CDA1 family)
LGPKTTTVRTTTTSAIQITTSTQKPSTTYISPTTTTTNPQPTGQPAEIIEKCKTPGHFSLTFDDGPSTNVPALLAKLKQLNVKATFYVNGNNFANLQNPNGPDAQRLKQIFDEGHQIASHTFRHPDLATLTPAKIQEEMDLNDQVIKAIIGQRPTMMRLPFLSSSPEVLKTLGGLGFTVVGVNIDTKDFEFNGKPTAIQDMHKQVDPIINNSSPYTDSFISLNHDFIQDVVQWTDEFVTLAIQKGYKLVTSAECVGVPMYRA